MIINCRKVLIIEIYAFQADVRQHNLGNRLSTQLQIRAQPVVPIIHDSPPPSALSGRGLCVRRPIARDRCVGARVTQFELGSGIRYNTETPVRRCTGRYVTFRSSYEILSNVKYVPNFIGSSAHARRRRRLIADRSSVERQATSRERQGGRTLKRSIS